MLDLLAKNTESYLLDAAIESAGYGSALVLHDIVLRVRSGEAVAIVGANGAGKSTLMRAIMGMVSYSGRVVFRGENIDELGVAARTRRGLVMVPENKGLFPSLSVDKHLLLAAAVGKSADWTVDRVRELFPVLQMRRSTPVGALSGGEQQMVAVSRALLLNPHLLMLDEPSLGLAPSVCDTLFERLVKVCQTGLAVVLSEQNPNLVLSLAKRVLVVRQGRVVDEREGAAIGDTASLASLYLGE